MSGLTTKHTKVKQDWMLEIILPLAKPRSTPSSDFFFASFASYSAMSF